MILGPLDLLPLRDRLRANVPEFADVFAVGSLTEAQSASMPVPCAFVLLAEEQAQPRAGGSGGRFQQRVTATVGVLLALPYYAAEQSAGPSVRPFITATRAALVGHKPDGAETVLQLAGGRMVGQQDSALLWLDRYRVDYWIQTP